MKTMYRASDFKIENGVFRIRKDSYPLKRINNIRVKKLGIRENLFLLLFWVGLISGGVWLAWSQFGHALPWLRGLSVILSILGGLAGLSYSARYALQIEFKHTDGTGNQWFNAARCRTGKNKELFEQQAKVLKSRLA